MPGIHEVMYDMCTKSTPCVASKNEHRPKFCLLFSSVVERAAWTFVHTTAYTSWYICIHTWYVGIMLYLPEVYDV